MIGPAYPNSFREESGMRRIAFVLSLTIGGLAGISADSTAPLLLQKPTLSRTHIAFVYAGDLWTVPRAGGPAQRLTSGAGVETNPVYSPDGSTIAFTGEYDGNTDVYTVPAGGGVPKRLTWHPAPDTVLSWTPDGKKILFASPRDSYASVQQLYTMDVNGSFPERLELPWGWEATYSPDGSRLAYVPMRRAFNVWKRYRGGETTPVWIATLADSKIEKIPRDNSNDFNPLWIGGKVYFLSDRNGPVTLFSYDTRTRQVKEEVKNDGFDFKSIGAGTGGDAIVIEQFGGLAIFDVRTSQLKSVSVEIAGDLPEVRPRMMNVGARLTGAHLSPNATRALFEARGDIITVPAEKGDPRNLTHSPNVMDRFPVWSPDGKTIAYFSDESGEYALHLASQTGTGEVVKIAMPEPGFYREARWSPDSKKLAFCDSHMRIWYVDVESRKTTQVAKERFWNPFGSDWSPVWSPDSKWLAYSTSLPNYLGAIHLYSLGTGKATQITDGMSDARNPVFDKDGRYLYFTASTDSGPSLQPDVGSFSRPVTENIYLVVLSRTEPSPFAPESDEEKPADAPKTDDARPGPPQPGPAAPPKPPAPPADVAIDFENIGQRILSMPLPPRRYAGLQVGKAGVLFALETPAQAPGQPSTITVHRHDLKSRKTDVAASGVRFFEVSSSGDKMLTRQGDNWFIRNLPPPPPAGATPPPPTPPATGGQLNTSTIEVKISPRDEWLQMFKEAWRIERDFFYDPGFHGLNLRHAQERYERFVEGIGSRADLNYLFAEMLGNLVVGHLSVGGGDTPDVKRVQTGLLGCDYKIENGRYRFARVFNGENWNPQATAPLTQPGVNVAAGEYLLAVNGRNLTASDNVYSFFEATAGKQVQIRVGTDPGGAGARTVTVVPIANENRLRNLAWIEDNRRTVDRMTGGRVAYVYLPDTAFGGFTNFTRYFFAQVDKQAVIVDERFNGGGALATDIVEFLSRKLLSSIATRDGGDELEPQGAILGPKVMLINEFAGSGGDAMPWYFRRAGVGRLIGKRTWGGLVGRAGSPALMDGGVVAAPSSGVWDPEQSQWIAENVGISPDIEVEYDPEAVRHGHDPQLERAVQEILGELAKNPPKTLKRPTFPKYQTMK
jgi:tricorn protease